MPHIFAQVLGIKVKFLFLQDKPFTVWGISLVSETHSLICHGSFWWSIDRPTRLRLRIFKWSAGSEQGWNGDCVLTRFCIYLVRLARGSCKAFNEDGLGFVPVPFYWEETASLSAAWGEGEGYGYHTCILVAFLHLSLKHQEMLSLCPWPVPVLPSGHGWIYTRQFTRYCTLKRKLTVCFPAANNCL